MTMAMHLITTSALALLASSGCNGFTTPNTATQASSTRGAASSPSTSVAVVHMTSQDGEQQTRRSVLSSILGTTVAAAAGASVLFPSEAFAEAETMERGGVKLTPFNSLAFNYREGESPTTDVAALGEDSISYADFLEKLNSDQVEFVKFLAPNGDVAYATFKSTVVAAVEGEEGSSTVSSSTTTTSSKPIRIGEGYPIEDPEGWSSPAFVIKAVAKKNVPYKFVVPGLGDSFNNM